MSILDAPPTGSRGAGAAAVVGTLLAHGALVLLASIAGAAGVVDFKQLMPVTEADLVEVELPKPPPAPQPEPEPAPAKPSPRAAPRLLDEPPPPPPSAAQAGQILDAKSDAVDFGDQFVTADGDSFGGGRTDAAGTSKTAVTDPAARGNAGGPAQAPPPAPVVDRSRPPKPLGSTLWQCPFPLEADDADIHHAVVTLRFEIAADGSVKAVQNTTDPGSGFAREARRCGARSRWQPALDKAGHPVDGVLVVRVTFERQ